LEEEKVSVAGALVEVAREGVRLAQKAFVFILCPLI